MLQQLESGATSLTLLIPFKQAALLSKGHQAIVLALVSYSCHRYSCPVSLLSLSLALLRIERGGSGICAQSPSEGQQRGDLKHVFL